MIYVTGDTHGNFRRFQPEYFPEQAGMTKNDVVIMDMEAGLEHLGRGTAANMDQFIVVIEPGARSVQTYHNVKRLAKDLGITRVRVVANKIRDDGDEEFIRSAIPAEDLLGFIHYNPDIIDADRQGKSPYDFSPAAIEEIRKIKAILDRDESKIMRKYRDTF